MRLIAFLILSVAAVASEPGVVDLAGSHESKSDERVVAEVQFTIEADTLPAKQEGTLFFVPIELATKEEKARNRAFAQYAEIKKLKPFTAWSYDLGIWPRPDGFEIQLSTDREMGDAVKIAREASFHVERFANVRVEKAGIVLTLAWKMKPNQPAQPTRGKAPRG
jgi:hypothetical protein